MEVPLTRIDRIVLAIDAPPFDLLYRGLVGYVVSPLDAMLGHRAQPFWGLLGALLLVMAASRVLPMLLRRLLPLSRAVKNIWAERRQLAKHADSYQWRKMLGVGLGWALWCLQSRTSPGAAPFIAALVCVGAGLAGWALWWTRAARYKVPTDQPAKVH